MNRKKIKKCHRKKAAVAFFLVLVLTLSPCSSFFWGNVAVRAETFTIKKLRDRSIIQDGFFHFFGKLLLPEVFYWIKSDGSPLFCIQKEAFISSGITGSEVVEEFGDSQYLNEEQYELISLVLQCCGMLQGEKAELDPGTYLAGQAAVWGITSPNWKDSQYFRDEMEKVYAHIENWYDIPAEEILASCQKTSDCICQAIDAYYGDESPYIPPFASKYEKKAPIWIVSMQEDESCEIVFMLEGKSKDIKDFVFQMPEGWSYEWQEDRIIFRCEHAKAGLFSIEGKAKEGTALNEAMPIGLIHIVGSDRNPYFQRLALEVECKTNWRCYFKLLVSEPEDPGSWYLPEVYHYCHQETFSVLYGVELEKMDGETMEPVSGVEFQPLEYFNAHQLEDTRLDKKQIESWRGWKAECNPEFTDENGYLEHWDRREYSYEKTYCSGHPEPVITYEGSDEHQKKLLEEEAQEAWEEEVEECSRKCDFHTLDGSGREQLEEDRDLTYQQFIHLVYGYTFKEIKAAPGYLSHGEHPEDKEIERVFLTSLQAGGEIQEEKMEEEQEVNQKKEEEEKQEVEISVYSVDKVKDSWGVTASNSDAELKAQEKKTEEEKDKEDKAEEGKDQEERAEEGKSKEERAEEGKGQEERAEEGKSKEERAEEKGEQGNENGEEKEQRIEQKRIKKARRLRKEDYIWLTSLIESLVQVEVDNSPSYRFTVKNYKKETPPQETPPQETPPQETPPQETPPQETLPQEIPPEETLPEKEPPEENPPEKALPQETLPSFSNGSGGKRRKIENSLPDLPQETSEAFLVEEGPVPQAVSHMGWIEAEYATPSIIQKGGKDRESIPGFLPKTGDGGMSLLLLLLICGASGVVLILLVKKRRKASVFLFFIAFCFPWTGESYGTEWDGGQASPMEDKLILYFSKEEASGDIEVQSGEWMYEQIEEQPGEWKSELAEQGENGGIKEVITDESGQKYWLESCRLVWRTLPEKEEWISENMDYQAVEANMQIPQSLWYQTKEDTGRNGEGELLRTSVAISDTYWSNQFQIPLRFCDYDAETYQFQEMEVPKEQALEYLLEHQQGLLEAVGCSCEAYRLKGIDWNGESYLVQGVAYRDALAYGEKLVSDCSVEYAGKVVYPQQEQEQWEAIYALQVPVYSPPEIVETQMQTEEIEEMETDATESDILLEEEGVSWRQIRTIIAYTVSLAVFLPALVYIILLARRRKKFQAEK